MEFGHLLDYNQYIMVVSECQVFLRRIEKKKRRTLRQWKKQ